VADLRCCGGEAPIVGGVSFPLRPMVAVTAPLPTGAAGTWAFEPKFDGFRCKAFAATASLSSPASSGSSRGTSPEVVATVEQLDREVVLDGELVVWCGGRLDFAALQQRLHPATARCRQLSITAAASYVVFDLVRARNPARGR
jgi:ATP-dependent DNA ligase